MLSGQTLIKQIEVYENLYGSIILAPELSFAKKDVHNYLDKMVENKVVAIRMFPETFNHSMKKWQIGDILNYMQYKKLPLLLWQTQTDWDIIQEICEDYSDLPVIIEGNDQKLLYHNRFFIPLLQKHNNFYLETHNLIQYMGIEYIVNDLGINRLIFGTYFPFNDPDAAMMMITHADIDENIKHKIANRNLMMLIDNIVK